MSLDEEQKQEMGNTQSNMDPQAEAPPIDGIVEAYRPNLYDAIKTLEENKAFFSN